MIAFLKWQCIKLLRFLEYLQLRFDKKSSNKVLVLRLIGGNPGLFSYFIRAVGFIRYAHLNGYVPAIDMMNVPNTYINIADLGRINAWDYFFQQPTKIENLPNDSKVIEIEEAQPLTLFRTPWGDWDCLLQGTITNKLWRLYVKKYTGISIEVIRDIDQTYNRLFSNEDKVLGVLCRGTDYTAKRPSGHPVQPSAEIVINEAYRLINKYGYNKIFLATEDDSIYKKFKSVFGNTLVVSTDDRIEYSSDRWINEYLPEKTMSKLEKGKDYLISIGILSRCKAFIGGRTSGSVGVMLLTEGFEYSYIWDLGLYN